MGPVDHHRPGPLDVAAGFLIGEDLTAGSLPRHARRTSPVVALESVLRPMLVRAPCIIGFSGGRDSAAILAMATDVARREGLPLPIPATLVYPDIPEADETSWQELILHHLGLTEWHRIEIHDELSVLSPLAVEVLRRYGLLWPARAYVLVPLLDVARGGSFISGHGGDELFTSRGSALNLVAAGRRRPEPRDILRLGLAMSPRLVRLRVARARDATSFPWLRPEGTRQVKDAFARWMVGIPARWDRALNSWWRSRDLQATREAVTRLAQGRDVQVLHPFTEPSVLIEMRKLGGASGFSSRTAAMEILFGHVLPVEVLRRSSKASFDCSLWSEATMEFARSWDGRGVDSGLVDVGMLREMWQSPSADGRTVLLLQSAWQATNASTGGISWRRGGVSGVQAENLD